MYCSNCGSELPSDAKFCSNCGTAVVPVNTLGESETNPNSDMAIEDTVVRAENDKDSILESGNELVSALEGTIPGVYLVGDQSHHLEQDNLASQNIQIPEVNDSLSENESSLSNSSAGVSANSDNSRVPYEYQIQEGQPAYVQNSVNVFPPSYVSNDNKAETQGLSGSGSKVKKKSKLPLIIGLLVLALVAGFLIYQSLPSVKYDKAMNKGEVAYDNKDYNEAIEQFQNALSFKPGDSVAQTDLFYSYDNLGMEAYSNDDYETAIRYYDEARIYCPDYDKECVDYISLIYSDWCLNTADSGAIDEAERIYNEAISAGYSMESTREELDVIIATAELMKQGQEVAQNLASEIDSGSLPFIFLEYNANGKGFANSFYEAGGEFPVVFDVEGCEYSKLGFYVVDGGIAFYYGDYSGLDRNGEGKWYYYSSSGIGSYIEYEMTGTWENDVPQGAAQEHILQYSSSVPTEWYVYSNVKDGLYDGEVTWDYVNDDTYKGSFTEGLVNVIDTVDPNGNKSNVIAYNESKNAWIYRSDDVLGRLNGIFGFRG